VLTEFQQIWECYNYIDCSNKVNLTNTTATIIGSVIGTISTIISWWIYNREQKTADKQDKILQNIERLEIKQERILEIVHEFKESHDEMLKTFLH
jgi:hypothetical protein